MPGAGSQREEGSKRPFPLRMGQDQAEWTGFNRQSDPGGMPDTDMQTIINARISGTSLKERPGQTLLPNPALTGCVVGIFDLNPYVAAASTGVAGLILNGFSNDATNGYTLLDVPNLIPGTDNAVQCIFGILPGGLVGGLNAPPVVQMSNTPGADSTFWAGHPQPTDPRVRSMLYSQSQVWLVTQDGHVAQLVRTPGSAGFGTWNIENIFAIPGWNGAGPHNSTGQLLYTGVEFQSKQWWAGPTYVSTNPIPINAFSWDGTSLIKEQVIGNTTTFSGQVYGHAQFCVYRDDLYCCVADVLVQRSGGAWTQLALPIVGKYFWPISMAVFQDALYIFGNGGNDGKGYILKLQGATFTVARTVATWNTGFWEDVVIFGNPPAMYYVGPNGGISTGLGVTTDGAVYTDDIGSASGLHPWAMANYNDTIAVAGLLGQDSNHLYFFDATALSTNPIGAARAIYQKSNQINEMLNA